MQAEDLKKSDKIVRKSLVFLQGLLSECLPRDFTVRLWDGTTWAQQQGMPSRFTFVINGPGSLRRMLEPPRELSLAEAYINRDVEIEGDLRGAFGLADYLLDTKPGLSKRLHLALQLSRLPEEERKRTGRRALSLKGASHSQERDREAISYHYNVSNDFYALWLDPRMVYSCAYFEKPDQELAAAQTRKIDYICRKLRLRRGERLLDIGCGWGGLLIHAVQSYGVEAHGVTLSRPQAEIAKERIRKAGLAGRCSVEVCDYREITDRRGFDKLASVGMFEHVGEELLPAYFAKARSLLKPGGVFLNHGIASTALLPKRKGPSFMDRYVFPDGEVLPLPKTLRIAEESGFEVRDVESLREHYALTLDHWIKRLEDHAEEACSLTDETTYRVWRLYLTASLHSFLRGRLSVYQTLFVNADGEKSCLPLTRADWYRRDYTAEIDLGKI